MRNLIISGATAALALCAVPALSQDLQDPARYAPDTQGVAIIYPMGGYGGQGTTLRVATPDLVTRYGGFNSIRVQQGVWQLCDQPRFEGRCTYTSVDHTSLVSLNLRRIASARPVRVIGQPPGRGGPGRGPGGPGLCAPGQNTSLRGVSSEYFPRPAENGCRVEVNEQGRGRGQGQGQGRGEGSNDATREADRFCRARGYNFSRNVETEQVGRRTFLADVLCQRN